MIYISALVLAISSNLDDLGFGFSLGLSKQVSIKAIGIIATISCLTMGLGIFIGARTSYLIPGNWQSIISALVFTVLGIYFFHHEPQDTEPIQLGVHQALGMGLALGIDSFLLGISGGIAGYPLLYTSALAFATSALFIWVGVKFGNSTVVKKILGAKPHHGSALMMFFLAVLQL